MEQPQKKRRYAEAVAALYRLERRGIKPGLSRINRLLAALGDPHLKYPAVHIAGTNGKGSVAAMLAAALTKAGYRTGLYTSPHLERFNERIKVDGVEISDAETSKTAASVLAASDALRLKPSFFDAATAMAFLHFAAESVDFAVVETGMGGRWDSTNVIAPVVSVITNVGIDHAEYLGPTIAEIAGEKAGIIKKGAPVVTAAGGKAATVIKRAAKGLDAPLYLLGRDFRPSSARRGGAAAFDYLGIDSDLKGLRPALAGPHQLKNAACALAAIELIRRAGFRVPAVAARGGIENARWPARLETFSKRPLVIVDAAHNPDGAAALAEAMKTAFKYKRLHLVLGILADKDVDGIVKRLVPLADAVYAAAPVTERAASAKTLLELVVPRLKRRAAAATAEKSVAAACERAIEAARSEDAVLIAGSVYTAGEARKYLLKTL